MLTDGQRIYATRYAINGLCPSLYYGHNIAAFPDSQIIVSEALDSDPNWQAVDDNQLLILDPKEPLTTQAL